MSAETVTLKYDLDLKYIDEYCRENKYEQFNKHFKIYIIDSYGNKHYCKKIYPAI